VAPPQERLETLSLEAAEASGSAANLSAKVQRLEASLKQDKSKRAVLRQSFKAKMAAATRESDLLKDALKAANVPLPDLTPLPSTDAVDEQGKGEEEEEERDGEAVSAAEMVLLLRQEVAHLKKELEVANAKVANAAAAQSSSVDDEEEEEEEEEEVIALKDDPKYAKYFKMLAMHLPKPVRAYLLISFHFIFCGVFLLVYSFVVCARFTHIPIVRTPLLSHECLSFLVTVFSFSRLECACAWVLVWAQILSTSNSLHQMRVFMCIPMFLSSSGGGDEDASRRG